MSIETEIPEDFDFDSALHAAVMSFLTSGDMVDVQTAIEEAFDLDEYQSDEFMTNFTGVIYTAATNVEKKINDIIYAELEKIRKGEVEVAEFKTE